MCTELFGDLNTVCRGAAGFLVPPRVIRLSVTFGTSWLYYSCALLLPALLILLIGGNKAIPPL